MGKPWWHEPRLVAVYALRGGPRRSLVMWWRRRWWLRNSLRLLRCAVLGHRWSKGGTAPRDEYCLRCAHMADELRPWWRTGGES
jgi:hypothetical protein